MTNQLSRKELKTETAENVLKYNPISEAKTDCI